jgi:hypothetical protein
VLLVDEDLLALAVLSEVLTQLSQLLLAVLEVIVDLLASYAVHDRTHQDEVAAAYFVLEAAG